MDIDIIKTTQSDKEHCTWVSAQIMLYIYNPEIWTFCRDKIMKRKNQLYYRTKGIVLHDRVLNNREK